MSWQDLKEEVKERNDIVSVVSEYTQLKRNGNRYISACPFPDHDDSSPSFYVYPENGSCYCFGCMRGGDVFRFLEIMEGFSFFDSLKYLAERSGISLPEKQTMPSKEDQQKKRIYEINKKAAGFFYNTLIGANGGIGLNYLRENRRLSNTTIRKFGLGLSPNEWTGLLDYMKNEGFSREDLEEANLIRRTKKGNYIDSFRNRVMYPIIDTQGHVVAFGGRTMGDDKPKYINSSDTPVYKKSFHLYNMNLAVKTREKYFILCEGYMDVIALTQAGFDNVIAGLGTALTKNQAELIKKHKKEVVLCYDSDAPGQKAAFANAKILDQAGLRVSVISTPDGKDPDEFIKSHGENGYAIFKSLIENATEGFEYFYERFKNLYDVKSSEGKQKIAEESARFLAETIGDVQFSDTFSFDELKDIKLSSRISVVSKELDIGKGTFFSMIKKYRDEFTKQKEKAEHFQEQYTSYSEPEYYSEEIQSQQLPTKNINVRLVRALSIIVGCMIDDPSVTKIVIDKIFNSEFYLTGECDNTLLQWSVLDDIQTRFLLNEEITFFTVCSERSEEEKIKIRRMYEIFKNTSKGISSYDLCCDCIDVVLSECMKKDTAYLMKKSDDELKKYFEQFKNKKQLQ